MRKHSLEWTVLAKDKRKKDKHAGFWVTAEQRRGIKALANELGYDLGEMCEVAIVQLYERLGQGDTAKYHSMADDSAVWREMAAKARERVEDERKAIRGRQ